MWGKEQPQLLVSAKNFLKF